MTDSTTGQALAARRRQREALQAGIAVSVAGAVCVVVVIASMAFPAPWDILARFAGVVIAAVGFFVWQRVQGLPFLSLRVAPGRAASIGALVVLIAGLIAAILLGASYAPLLGLFAGALYALAGILWTRAYVATVAA